MTGEVNPMHGVSIEEARRTLGDLVTRAYHTGQITYVTRHGKPAAVIAPAGHYGAELTDADLATHHLGLGPGSDEQTDREFWRRFPQLQGWYQAAAWLWQEHFDAWSAGLPGGYNPATSPLTPDLPVYDDLMRQYRLMVQHIADGKRRHTDPTTAR